MVRLFELLGKKSIVKILEYFLRNPTARIHAQSLGKRISISRKAMLDALHVLADRGTLQVEDIGRTRQYSLARSAPLVMQLKRLDTLDWLLPLVKGLEGTGCEVYLFGSAARGEDTEKSDIDILIIGEMKRGEVMGRLGSGERLRPIHMTHMEYSALSRKDPAFYERIETDKVRLV